MLAYVFWHWKRTPIAAHEYEALQRAFHAALAADPSSGFQRSLSVGLSGAPWADSGNEAYEDWYLVDDFGALEALNEAAISARRSAPHDAAAAEAAGGSGGVYRLRIGELDGLPRYACWFGKPGGMPYSELFARLAPVVEEARGALWMRQMVLGPAREFCLHAPAPVSLPGSFDVLTIPLRPAWPNP